jgi:sRNA-binding protein
MRRLLALRTGPSSTRWPCTVAARYLEAIAAGGPRYALDGTTSGEVREEHRAAAVLVLKRRR